MSPITQGKNWNGDGQPADAMYVPGYTRGEHLSSPTTYKTHNEHP